MADKSQDAGRLGLDTMTAQVGTNATLEVFTGTKPANCAAAETGTKISLHNMNAADAFQNATVDAVEATAVANAIASSSVLGGGGTAGYFRIKKSDGTTCVFQGTAGIGQELDFPDPVFTDGGTVSITSFQLRLAL